MLGYYQRIRIIFASRIFIDKLSIIISSIVPTIVTDLGKYSKSIAKVNPAIRNWEKNSTANSRI